MQSECYRITNRYISGVFQANQDWLVAAVMMLVLKNVAKGSVHETSKISTSGR